MDGPTLALALLAASIVVLAVYTAYAYNRLVSLRQRVENALSQIDIQLTRRHNLIPNLVATVRGYLAHERGLLEDLTHARAEASRLLIGLPGCEDAAGVAALGTAESTLTAWLAQLVGVVEAYPELKGAQQTGRLMEELASAENRTAFARQHYNDAAMRYNATCESFPALLVARTFGFSKTAYLEFTERSIAAPVEVSLTVSSQG